MFAIALPQNAVRKSVLAGYWIGLDLPINFVILIAIRSQLSNGSCEETVVLIINYLLCLTN